jgi:hypothetical protein
MDSGGGAGDAWVGQGVVGTKPRPYSVKLGWGAGPRARLEVAKDGK